MSPRRAHVLLFGVLLFAAVLRLTALADSPRGFFIDEAAICVNARTLRAAGRDQYGERLPFFFRALDDYKAPAFVYGFTAWSVVAGDDVWAARSFAAVLGLASILGAFALGREVLGSRRGGLLTAGLLALSPWHLQFSRIAWQAISLVLLHTWAVALILRGARLGRAPAGARSLVGGAVLLALTLTTYSPAKLWVPLLGVAVLLSIRRGGPWPWSARVTGAALAAFALAALPFTISYMASADAINLRFAEQSILTGPSPLWRAASNYLAHFDPGFLFLHGDANPRHSAPGVGMLLLPEAPLLLLGMWTLARSEGRGGGLIVAWILLAPLLGAFTKGAPHATRTIAMLPALQVAAAAGVLSLLRGLPAPRRRLATWLLGLVLALAGAHAVHTTVVAAPERVDPVWWRPQLAAVVSKARALAEEYDLEPIHFLPQTRVVYIDWLYLTRVEPALLFENALTTREGRDVYDPLDHAGRFSFAGAAFPGQGIYPGSLVVQGPGDRVPPTLVEVGRVGETRFLRAP